MNTVEATMPFEIYLVATPGLEQPLCDEARAAGFDAAEIVSGGVAFAGDWQDVWRANLVLRGATRVLARIAQFPAVHLAQLDKRARAVSWSQFLRADTPVKVEAVCRKSKIYHSGAAADRVTRAIADTLGAPIGDDGIKVMVRIEKDMVTISVDTSGELLHRRGFKEEVAKAPMRETMAAMFLAQCGFTGDEVVVDPMCGSGTFVIEAAEIAMGLLPGRSRTFAFERLVGFKPVAWQQMKSSARPTAKRVRFFGSDKDAGAIRMAQQNADRAWVGDATGFAQTPLDKLTAPEGEKGLVICNPPYGTRIGSKGPLVALYRQFGETMRSRFSGWRVGLITSDPDLAKATGLPLEAQPPVLHGGLRITLYTASL